MVQTQGTVLWVEGEAVGVLLSVNLRIKMHMQLLVAECNPEMQDVPVGRMGCPTATPRIAVCQDTFSRFGYPDLSS